MKRKFFDLLFWINRNRFFYCKREERHHVNLCWWDAKPNVGDYLSKVVVDWMLERKGISPDKYVKKRKYLYSIGSVIGYKRFDATIWGSGTLGFRQFYNIWNGRKIIKYDVRSVRGPITKKCLEEAGYHVPNVFGDPAILMPLVYSPDIKHKKYDVSIIPHHLNDIESGYHTIDMKTLDYKKVIDDIVSSKLIISSSLHGIILSEAYGIPCIFLKYGVDDQLFKYLDWYLSTGRNSFLICNTLNDALNSTPMELPDLSAMQKSIMEAFPYDLWEQK